MIGQIYAWIGLALLVGGIVLPIVTRFSGAAMFASADDAGSYMCGLVLAALFWPFVALLGIAAVVMWGLLAGWAWATGVKE